MSDQIRNCVIISEMRNCHRNKQMVKKRQNTLLLKEDLQTMKILRTYVRDRNTTRVNQETCDTISTISLVLTIIFSLFCLLIRIAGKYWKFHHQFHHLYLIVFLNRFLYTVNFSSCNITTKIQIIFFKLTIKQCFANFCCTTSLIAVTTCNVLQCP